MREVVIKVYPTANAKLYDVRIKADGEEKSYEGIRAEYLHNLVHAVVYSAIKSIER